jgi:HlyD family secretion protein
MISRNKKIIFLVFGAVIIALMVAYASLKFIMPVELNEGRIAVSEVERGIVMQTLQAKGVVEPQQEVLINSPANSTVQRILNEPGRHVKNGQVILTLDQQPVLQDIENIEDQLEMKRNALQKNILNARSTRVDLEYNVEMKKLKIASIKSQLTDEEQLLEVGGISPANVEKTRQALTSAEKDLEMIMQKNRIRLKQLAAEKEGLRMQIEMEERKLNAKRALLQKMYVKAPSSGIILNITKKAGEKVKQDDLLITMSDLSSFKIIGSLEENQADFVKTGKLVLAIIDNDNRITGKIGNIRPRIENNMIQFDVFLDQSNHEKLIPNMRIDLLLVKNQKDSVLRVRKGPAIDKSGMQKLYVKDGDRAYRKQVEIGLTGLDYVEIKSGVNEGDEIIVSDVSTFRKRKSIEIQ